MFISTIKKLIPSEKKKFRENGLIRSRRPGIGWFDPGVNKGIKILIESFS